MRRLLARTCLPIVGLAFACGRDEPTGPTSGSDVTPRPLAEEASASVVIASTAVDQAGDVGRYTSLAIGPDGRRHITYYDDTKGNLKYASCAGDCAFAGSWNKGVVDNGGDGADVGFGSSLR